MTHRGFRGPALLVTAGALALAAGCSGGSAASPGVEQRDLTVAVVPAVDSAGFFVALHDGLFERAGLHITFVPARYAFPAMAGAMRAGKVDAAVLPEPFASAAELQDGAIPLADLDQGATTEFPIEGYAVTKAWAKAHPKTLAAFYRALEEGQEIADTDRSAIESAMEHLPPRLSVPAQTAAVMAVPEFPVSQGPAGSINEVRLQRVADVMEQFLAFPAFNVKSLAVSS